MNAMCLFTIIMLWSFLHFHTHSWCCPGCIRTWFGDFFTFRKILAQLTVISSCAIRLTGPPRFEPLHFHIRQSQVTVREILNYVAMESRYPLQFSVQKWFIGEEITACRCSCFSNIVKQLEAILYQYLAYSNWVNLGYSNIRMISPTLIKMLVQLTDIQLNSLHVASHVCNKFPFHQLNNKRVRRNYAAD